MRKLLKALLITGSFHALGLCAAGPVVVISNTGLAYSTAVPVNLNLYNGQTVGAKNLAAQVTWSSSTLPAQNFTDGRQSTATITIGSNLILSTPATDQITVPSTLLILGAPATGQFTVASTAAISGQSSSFTVVLQNYAGIALSSPTLILNNDFYFTYGSNWASTDTIQHAASTLASAINGNATASPIYTASVVSSTGVLIVLDSSGTFGNSYTVTSTSATDISTGTMNGGVNPTSVTLNGKTFTAIKDWAVGANTSSTASNIVAVFNQWLGSVIISTSQTNVIYATATVNGTQGNSYGMSTRNSAGISTSAATMSGGINRGLQGASITFNGVIYPNGYQWTDTSNTSTGTAISVAALFQSFGVVSGTCAAGTGSIIYSTATTNGYAGNSYTLSATSPFTVSSASYTAGQDAGNVSVNGKLYTAGVNFSTGAATSNTATNLATAITASSVTYGVTATAAGAIVSATSTVNGVNAYPITTNITKYISLSGTVTVSGTSASTTMGAGVAPSYAINTQTIGIPNHGFPTGLAVYLSTTNAVGIYYSSGTVGATKTLLAAGATVYIIAVDANDIAISTNSAPSGISNAVTLVSSMTSTTSDTFTLTPETFVQGAASGQWNISNDGVNYLPLTSTIYNVSISSDVFTAVNPSSTTLHDLGQVDYGYMEYKVLAPSAGAVNLKVILNSKD